VGWARTYLHKAGLVDSKGRGRLQISPRGLSVLKTNPPKIDVEFLRQYPEFVEFQSSKRDKDRSGPQIELPISNESTPEGALETSYQKLRADLEAELLERIKIASPAFFERLVIDVLVKMGYGGSRFDAGLAIGRSGDGGIDGIIKEDRLGLDVIYIQAKRWENTVGRPEIQRFAGALQGHRARKGVFITTSSFTKEAQEYARSIDIKIVLINGLQLAKMMIDQNVGISTVISYEIKKIDSDYFEEE
jgi:restriction system protein